MTDTAPVLTPASLMDREKADAAKPVKKSAGTVPSPKRAMRSRPVNGLPVMAAFTIMAQENMQGRNPAKNPSITREREPGEARKRAISRLKTVTFSPDEARGMNRKGPVFRRASPKRTIKTPPAKVAPVRRPLRDPCMSPT